MAAFFSYFFLVELLLQGPANRHCGDCETCGAKLSDCPGHFGYLVLAVPVFNVGYLSTVVDILKCICKVLRYISFQLNSFY